MLKCGLGVTIDQICHSRLEHEEQIFALFSGK
jgi:hypothetical protein